MHTKYLLRVLSFFIFISIATSLLAILVVGKDAQVFPVAYAAAPVTSLSAYWSLDNATGTSAIDISGNNNKGVLTNGPVWAAAKLNNGLTFDGVNDYVVVPNSTSLNASGTAITVSFWAKITDTGKDSVIIGKMWGASGFSSPYYQYGVEYGGGGSKKVDFYFGSTASKLVGPFSMTPQLNTWVNVTYTYDGITVRGYLNGVQQIAIAQTGKIASRTSPLRFGTDGSTKQPFKGMLDEVRIYKRAITAQEVTDIYNAGSVPDTLPPSVPLNPVATPVSATRIDLSWSTSTDNVAVTGYKVYRNGAQVATTTAALSQQAGLVASTSYDFTISAFDAAGNTSAQSVVFSTTTLPLPPVDTTAPFVSLLTPVSSSTLSGSVVVSATSSDNVGVSGVRFVLDGVSLGAEDVSAPYSVTWNTALSSDGIHVLAAISRDAAGNSSTSTVVVVNVNNAPVPDNSAPTTPLGLIASVVSSNRIDLRWSTSTDNIAVTGYRVYRNGVQVGSTTLPFYVDGGLTASTSYDYAVSAFDAAGNTSALSASVSQSTPPASSVQAGLDFPSNLVTDSVRFKFDHPENQGLPQFGPNDRGVTYIWKIYPRHQAGYYTTFFWGPDGGFTGTGYYGAHPYPDGGGSGTLTHKWEVSADGGDFVIDLNGNDTSLGYNQWYTQALRVWVSADGRNHHEFYWNLPDTNKVISYTTQYPNNGNPVPQNAALTFGDAPWSQSQEMLNGILRGIQIYNANLSLSDIQSEITSPLSTAAGSNFIWYLNINPTPDDIADKSGKGHNPFWVNSMRPALYSEGVDITTPSVPVGVNAVGISQSRIGLSWTQSTDDMGVVGYQVFRNGVMVGTTSLASYSDNGLNSATSYTYTVTAYDAAGNISAQSVTASATTSVAIPDSVAPSVPSALSAFGITQTQIGLSWAASTDNVGVVGYKVFLGGVQVATATAVSYVQTGLSASTSYVFAVTAYDEAGNTSSLSNTLTVSTLPLTPPGQNLIAAYGFNEGSGTVITNSATATYNGTYVGTPAWTAGKNGGGLTFSGSSGYVNMGDVNSVDGVNALTVSAWMKTTGTTEQHLVDKGICQGVVNDGPFELGANFFTSGRASFVIYKSGGSPNYYPLESSVAVNDGLWHHISATYDGSTMRMYVDGIASGQASVPGVILSSTSNALEVGGHCNGGSILWKGSVDDVRIYSRALSPAEVATDMNTPL